MHEHNVPVQHGDPTDPHLPTQGVNAVLIANTYHDFTDSQAILAHVFKSLVLGGRLVVVDRAPQAETGESKESEIEHHEVSSDQVEGELRKAGFEIVGRQDHFIENDPFDENWWLIAGRKSQLDRVVSRGLSH